MGILAAAAMLLAAVGPAAGTAIRPDLLSGVARLQVQQRAASARGLRPADRGEPDSDALDEADQAARFDGERTAPGLSVSAGALVAAQQHALTLPAVRSTTTGLTGQPTDAEPAGYTDPNWSTTARGSATSPVGSPRSTPMAPSPTPARPTAGCGNRWTTDAPGQPSGTRGRIFAATSQGLYSHPNGATGGAWTLVLKPDPNPTGSPFDTSFITDVVVRPGTHGRTVLAVDGWRNGTPYNGFYLSTTGGGAGSFHKITPTGTIDAGDIGRTTLAYAADGSRLYAIVESPKALLANDGTNLQGVFVSASGTATGQ